MGGMTLGTFYGARMFTKAVSMISGNPGKRKKCYSELVPSSPDTKTQTLIPKMNYKTIKKAAKRSALVAAAIIMMTPFGMVPKFFAITALGGFVAKKRTAFFAMLFLMGTTALGLFSDFFLVLALHGFAALSRIHYRFLRFSIGIELSIFMIALTGISHGPVTAAIVGAVHFLISVMVTREPKRIILPCLLGYVAVGLAAGLLPITNMLLFGMVLVAVYNLVTVPLFIRMLDFSFGSQLFFILTHVGFNYYIFSQFGDWGLRLIGA